MGRLWIVSVVLCRPSLKCAKCMGAREAGSSPLTMRLFSQNIEPRNVPLLPLWPRTLQVVLRRKEVLDPFSNSYAGPKYSFEANGGYMGNV